MVALVATLGGGAVMGMFVFSGKSNEDLSFWERVGVGVTFAVSSVTIPFILLVALLAGLYFSKVLKRAPSSRQLLAIIGGLNAVQFAAFHAWWWFGDHLDSTYLEPGPFRLWLGFLLGGLAVGALAGRLIRIGAKQSPNRLSLST